jgi:hypothetical protein
MRLLDLIAQGQSARIRADDGIELPGALRFSAAIQACPLRYVLSDELTRCATQLAFAEGDRLSSCLDLIRVPAESLWVEWADPPRRQALQAIPSLGVKEEGPPSRHGGALISAASSGRSGHIRTFWSCADDRAYLSPMVTTFDLDRCPTISSPPDPKVWRAETRLTLPAEPAIEELLNHLRFSLDEEWAAYYSKRCHSEELRITVTRYNLGGCGFDAPMLIAFFLLLNARDLLPHREVRHERLNRIRRTGGKPPLLEHIELSAPLDRAPAKTWSPAAESHRSSPRLHHVRGHIVRRGTSVFWRSPHLRGSARLGQVRSRTVLLTFNSAATEPARACH